MGLKRLITTCYKNQERDFFSKNECDQAVYLEYEGDKNGNHIPDAEEIGVKPLKGDGDFRSAECIELLKQADIVVTNPPFSLFREYVDQLMKYNKKFVIIGSLNAISYKEVFKYIKDNKIGLGYSNGAKTFITSEGKEQKFGNIGWYTNLDISKRHENLILYKNYTPDEFPKYDNYDAINVDKVANIPCDYNNVMGVPITFLDKYNPEQFEIIGNEYDLNIEKGRGYIKGKRMYSRIFIRRKH